MAPNPRRQDERLAALYAQLPTIECQGFCHDSCGPIDLTVRERVKIERAAGYALGCNGIKCNMLVENRCSVYELRPMICRAWGVVEGLPCHYGCKPEPGYMSDYDFAVLIVEAMKVGGGMTHADRQLYRLMKEAQEELGQERLGDALREVFRLAGTRPTLAGRTPIDPILERHERTGTDPTT